jgi:hypothetical protein
LQDLIFIKWLETNTLQLSAINKLELKLNNTGAITNNSNGLYIYIYIYIYIGKEEDPLRDVTREELLRRVDPEVTGLGPLGLLQQVIFLFFYFAHARARTHTHT